MDGGIFGKNDAVAKIAKAFRLVPLKSITLDHGPEKFDRLVDRDTWRDQPAKARAIVTCAQIERVLIWSPSDKGDFTQKRTRASVRAPGYPQTNGILAQASFLQDRFKLLENLWQDPLALGKRKPARRQGHTRERIEAQPGALVLARETMPCEDLLNGGFLLEQ